MTDFTTTYLGLELKNPLVASASPLSKKLESAKRLEEAGAAAIVMYSLFEEQIIHESLELDHFLTRGKDSFSEALSYLPEAGAYRLTPDKYLKQVSLLKRELKIPIIGSLNGVSKGGWTRYARRIEEAGADALELNLYYLATDPSLKSEHLEAAQIELVSDIKSAITIPLSVKLSPYITSLPNFCSRLAEAGAQGLVLFNRFYQPDFDLQELEIIHTLELSTSEEIRLPLRWVSILYGKINADLALTSGVHTAKDALKAVMAGAKVAMLASKLLRDGEQSIAALLNEMEWWMETHEYESISQMRGSMCQKFVREPSAFERANYMKILSSWRDLV